MIHQHAKDKRMDKFMYTYMYCKRLGICNKASIEGNVLLTTSVPTSHV